MYINRLIHFVHLLYIISAFFRLHSLSRKSIQIIIYTIGINVKCVLFIRNRLQYSTILQYNIYHKNTKNNFVAFLKRDCVSNIEILHGSYSSIDK